MREKGNQIRMKIKIKLVEQFGVCVKVIFTRPDPSGCLSPDGASHLYQGANYTGKCFVCGEPV